MPDPQQQNAALNQAPYPKKVIPLTGKWIPANEGTDLGANFKQLTNLRYTDTHPKGIGGMTKINTSVMNATYLKARSAFHYTKSQPAESHLLVQAWNTGLTAAQILQNETAIPGTGEFEADALWTDAVGADIGYFSIAPEETLIYCNSKENLIWGGDEAKIGGFFISNPDSQVIYDYTERVQNTMTDSQNVATMTTTGGGLDANTKVLLPFENSPNDSTAGAHNFTVANVTYSSSVKRFGTYSAAFNGTNSTAYCADHADFDCSGGVWSVDCWVYFNSLSTTPVVWGQATDANNCNYLHVTTSGVAVYYLYTASAVKVSMQSGIGAIQILRWHHIEVTENANSYYLFIDGVLVGTASVADRPLNYTAALTVGAYYNGTSWSNYTNGYIDEFRMSVGVARHTAAFAPQVGAYSASASSTLYVISTRPLQAIKPYVQNPNASAATVVSDYWTGSGYSLTAVPIDYMEYASDALAQAAYVSSDTSADITVDLMEYATDGAAQTAYVSSAGGTQTPMDYLEYATDAAAQAAYVTNGGANLVVSSEGTIKNQGSYALKAVALITDSLNKTLTRNLYCQTTAPIDLTGQDLVSYDLRSTRTGSNIKLGLQQRYLPQDVNTKLLLHMDGANNGTTFTDACGKTVTVNGNTCTKTAEYKFGTASGYFDGNGDTLALADSEDWNFGSGDFTIDFWMKRARAATTEYLIDRTNAAQTQGWGLYMYSSNYIWSYFTVGGGTTKHMTSSIAISDTTTWHHIAFVRSGVNSLLFIDGALAASRSDLGTGVADAPANPVIIGDTNYSVTRYYYQGYIDEVRITKGRALWTAPFTVPAAVYAPTDLYTKLLLHCDGSNDGTTFTDECGHTVNRQNAVTKTGEKKFGTASVYCDGSDDYLWLADGADWYFASADFTIDFWINFSELTAGSWYGIMSQHGATNGSRSFQLYKYTDSKFNCDFFVGATGYQITWNQAGYNTGQWYHFAFVRTGNDFKFFVDGAQVGSTVSQAGSWVDGNDPLIIGSAKDSGGTIRNFKGYIDEVRISKGVARWTTGFTAPAKAYNSTAVIETTPAISSAGAFESKTWDIAGTADADKNNIDGIILTIVNADADNTFYLDNLRGGNVPPLQSYSEATYKQQGSYALKAVAQQTTGEAQTLTRTIGSPIDLSGVQTAYFDVRASRMGINFTLAIHDAGGTWTSISPNILVADVYQTVTWDLSSVADADKDAIDQIKVTIDNATAKNTIYIDNFYTDGPPVSLSVFSEATIITQGVYSLKGTATITTSLNETLTRTLSSPIDLTGVSTIGFDIRSSRTGSNIKIGIHDSGGTTTEITPNITDANTWQSVIWDISGVSDANKNVINSIIITIVNADADNTFYIDNFGPAGGALYDGTALAGKTLAQTGIISFGPTTSTAKPKMYNGLVGYLYRFTFTGIDSGVTVSHATVDAPMQPIVDLWDGVDRECMAFYVYKNSTYNDYTLSVFENEYDSNDTSSFVELDSLTTGSQKLYFASYERLMGINFGLIGGHVNTTGGTTMTIKYSSDGSTFTTVGTIDDGTSVGGVSFGQSGTVTWNPPAAASEFMSKISKVTPRYHYEISFSQTFSADVQIFYVSGIPVQRAFGQYKFPLMAQDMLFLCCNMAGRKNAAVHSEYQTSQIFNGDNAGEVEFGETGELTCGASLYNLYGYNLYNLIIFFKDNEMWKLSGNFPNWQRHLVSETVGCPAPMTLKAIGLPGDVPQGLSRNVIVWQGSQGVYISDGRAALPIHADIENYFDEKRAECIKASLIGASWADIDMRKMEYHLHVASGSSATVPDTELVFDLKRWRWFEVERGTGKRLICGTSVKDTDGNYYNYGFIDTGYMLRLENGTDFDGNDITHTLELGDIVLNENDFTMETRVERLQLVTVANDISLNDITYTHYVDTETTGTAFTLAPRATNKRIADIVKPINSKVGVFHSGKFEMTTDNEVTGFEPLALAYLYSVQYEKVV